MHGLEDYVEKNIKPVREFLTNLKGKEPNIKDILEFDKKYGKKLCSKDKSVLQHVHSLKCKKSHDHDIERILLCVLEHKDVSGGTNSYYSHQLGKIMLILLEVFVLYKTRNLYKTRTLPFTIIWFAVSLYLIRDIYSVINLLWIGNEPLVSQKELTLRLNYIKAVHCLYAIRKENQRFYSSYVDNMLTYYRIMTMIMDTNHFYGPKQKIKDLFSKTIYGTSWRNYTFGEWLLMPDAADAINKKYATDLHVLPTFNYIDPGFNASVGKLKKTMYFAGNKFYKELRNLLQRDYRVQLNGDLTHAELLLSSLIQGRPLNQEYGQDPEAARDEDKGIFVALKGLMEDVSSHEPGSAVSGGGGESDMVMMATIIILLVIVLVAIVIFEGVYRFNRPMPFLRCPVSPF